jgi:hypothetical protein
MYTIYVFQLAQAHEEIRDLRSEVDRLKHVLELSEAGQAKLRVIAEMARKEGRYALDFVNSLMFNIVTQYRTKIVNFDNSVVGECSHKTCWSRFFSLLF